MNEPIEELRKVPRLSLQIPVRVSREIKSRPENSFFISSLTEISRDGAFVTTSVPYQPGSMIAMEFSLPRKDRIGEQNFRILGKVSPSSQERMGIGIRFVMMTNEEKTLIEDFVHQHRKTPTA